MRKGLAQRRHSRTDRRVVEVDLTDRGRSNYAEYLSLHLAFTEGLLAALSDREAEQYLDLLTKIVAHLEQLGDRE